MVRKHIYHFNRGLVIGLEILGFMILVAFLAWLGLIARLSQGPLNVDFLSQKIEAALNSQQAGFRFDVGSTVLTWGGTTQPFEFEMKSVQISRADKTPVLAVEKIGIQLSKRYLVFGKIVPRSIKIYGPALRVVRLEDGQFTLNMSDAAALSQPAADQDAGQIDFIKSLLILMKDAGSLGLWGGLYQVSVTDAALLYEDRILSVSWKSRKSDVIFTRRDGGLLVDSIANVEQDQAENAYVRGSFYYSWQTYKPNGVIAFTGFNPALLAQQSDKLKDFSGVDLPLKGSFTFEMDQNFRLDSGRFVLGADVGKFGGFGLYAEPIPVNNFYMQGRFDLAAHEASVEQLRIDLGGPTLNASAGMRRQDGERLITAAATLNGMPLDKLAAYWPASLAPDPRAWVTQHLSEGVATKATLNISLLAPLEGFDHVRLQAVGGEIAFEGVKVDYLPPLLPVTRVKGRAIYDKKSFTIDVEGGALGDMKVEKSKVSISSLDTQDAKNHAKIDIDAALAGPLKTALKVLESDKLQYPQKLGLRTAGVEGKADVDVNFKFPLHKGLALPEVKVAAKARLTEVMLKDVVAGFPLSGGPMNLSIDESAMAIQGDGFLAEAPVHFKWNRNFSEKADVASKVEAKISLNAAMLAKAGVPESFNVTGVIPADITYTVSGKQTTLLFKGDIGPVSFSLPVFGSEKPAGQAGALDLFLHFKNGKPARITSLNLETAGLMLKGNIDLGSEGQSWRKAVFDQVRFGGTDIFLSAENTGATGYAVKISGRQFDASQMLKDSGSANSDEEAAKPVTPFNVSMAVDRLVTGREKYVDRMKMYMRRNGWGRIEQLEVDGLSGNKPVYLRYLPAPKGHTLQFEAGNAGTALDALGITNGVRGGKVIVKGLPDPGNGPRSLQGSVVLTDFTLVEVPVLGRLLNALSLPGLFELLNGKGVAFKKMRADFWWLDRGQPDSAKNVRRLKVKDGKTSGASLGLTFEGVIDKWAKTLDMSGTIIPVSDLNKLLSIIPLVGDILTGGGEGMFAATYTIQGPTAQPTVTVNPLAALAPGILRQIFFEK